MDKHTPEQRRKNMQAVKNKDSQIELTLRKALWERGLRYRKNVNKIFGHPDVAFIGLKVAVFCDSEFWHGHDWKIRKSDIKSNREFWINKIERNIQRDKEVTAALEADGWIVLRYWGKDIMARTSEIAEEIEKIVRSRQCL